MADEEWLDGAALLGGGRPVEVVRLPPGARGPAGAVRAAKGEVPVQGALDGSRLLAGIRTGDIGTSDATDGRALLRPAAASSQLADDDAGGGQVRG